MRMESVDKQKMSKHKIIIMQAIFLVAVLTAVYLLYPKTNIEVNGDLVKFGSINSNVIIISENPDFSNPRYLDLEESKEISFNLEPGTYYWKSDNGIIEGFKKEFTIESEVGMKINRNKSEEINDADLVNIGNVKINVTKEGGTMVGHIILEPEESEGIEDLGKYIGRQETGV